MPKTAYTAKRRTYVPRRRAYGGATTRKPYGGSRYGNDAFVKVESIQNLSNTGTNVFSTMRVSPTQFNSPGNTYLVDQAEFNAFRLLYARYEVRGMKAEVTLNARTTFSVANISGGLAPRMPAIAVFPSADNNVAYPMQKDCNVQGEVTSLYYEYSKDLKNSGAEFAKSTEVAYDLQNQGIL